jgi:hypothetical protein
MMPPGAMPPGAPPMGAPMPGGPMMPGMMPPGPSPDDLRQAELLRLLDAAQDTGLPPGTTVPGPYAPPQADNIHRKG